MIVLKGLVLIAFGRNEQPATYSELVSIGGLNLDMNKKLSAGITSILENKLSVPKSVAMKGETEHHGADDDAGSLRPTPPLPAKDDGAEQ
ncbi:hypothetical protein AHAS_Ahas05G0221300 [Arachis hypogaea]